MSRSPRSIRFLRIRMREEAEAFPARLGISFIHVTHSQDEALALADLVIVMNAAASSSWPPRGRFSTSRGPPLFARFIGGHNVFACTVEDVDGAGARLSGPHGIRSPPRDTASFRAAPSMSRCAATGSA